MAKSIVHTINCRICYVIEFVTNPKHAKSALKGLKLRMKNDWNKQIAESKRITEKWKNGRTRFGTKKKTG